MHKHTSSLILLAFLLLGLVPRPERALAQNTVDPLDVTYVCATGENFTDCGGGPRVVVGQASSGNFAVMPALYPNPVALMLDVTNILRGQPEIFVADAGQMLGVFTKPLFPLPGEFRINLPIEPTGGAVDLDNDSEDDAGVQVYALSVASNIVYDGYLQQLEQTTGLLSYLKDNISGRITEGTFLIYAPDDAQGFPAASGADGEWFTADDPTISLPAGYTVATLSADGAVTLDRSPAITINTIERAEFKSPDFSNQGILESYNSLIDVLQERYVFTELRRLDWESIRATYLSAVAEADANQDSVAYFQVLSAIAAAINDTHVSVMTTNADASSAQLTAYAKLVAGSVGAATIAVSDEASGAIGERVIVLAVGADSPAAEAGWAPGTEIVSIDGESVADRLSKVPMRAGIGTEEVRRATQARSILQFPMDQSVTIGYRLPESAAVLTATMVAGEYALGELGSLSISALPVTYQQVDDYAVVRWTDFVEFIPSKLAVLEEALSLERSSESGGVILDLRGNGGGWVTLYETMASYFFTTEKPMPTRVFDWYGYDQAAGGHVLSYSPDYLISAPRPELAYTGPVVILIDEMCASACEYFTQHLQLLGRATVIGQYPSAGAGGSIDRVKLPGGHTFQFTKGGTYFADTKQPNLEAKGVVPDVRVPVTLETEVAKTKGQDPVLDAAIATLKQQADRLTTTTWRWSASFDAAVAMTPVEDLATYTLNFSADGTLTVVADCNRASGTYERNTDLGTVRIVLGPATMALCPAGSQSEAFLHYLGAAKSLAFDGDNLAILLDPASDVFGLLFSPVAPPASAAGATGFNVATLANASYSGIYEDPVPLTDGHYEGKPFVAGDSSRPIVDYVKNAERFADLDGDGVDDAIVFLVESSGGSGSFVYLAAQLNQAERPVDAGAVLIADRSQVRAVNIDAGQIVLDLIVPGPGDGACCPSYKTTSSYAVQDGMLTAVGATTELEKITIADLQGTAWTLTSLGDEPAAAEAQVTLLFQDGQLSGNGGCNNYNSSFTLNEDNPFVMTLGPIAATRMICPVGEQESAYLTALSKTSQWGYHFGRLALYYGDDQGGLARLLFVPTAAE